MLCNESAPQKGQGGQVGVQADKSCMQRKAAVRIAERCGRVALGALERNSSKGNAVR